MPGTVYRIEYLYVLTQKNFQLLALFTSMEKRKKLERRRVTKRSLLFLTLYTFMKIELFITRIYSQIV